MGSKQQLVGGCINVTTQGNRHGTNGKGAKFAALLAFQEDLFYFLKNGLFRFGFEEQLLPMMAHELQIGFDIGAQPASRGGFRLQARP